MSEYVAPKCSPCPYCREQILDGWEAIHVRMIHTKPFTVIKCNGCGEYIKVQYGENNICGKCGTRLMLQ
ncbi:MAG: hypothetical protein UT24_C0003G0020 [Candidatus Woesebacteria bacterium GW2011_GWB1_39_12]|uniref:Uncharacterized protein n=1 Tax=Candidatus Woesebacteria bacterium GW2011_GWB1_39_12 TaxID=1618574 RepID=A0A0G0MEL0_9BACT|nr:MAG: hypothetical protein UT24_C0003G0020 [Candidatus Woesebacteria bacterium GW2011_GWB1_39_12]